MGRHKKEIKKNVELKFRLEPDLKKQYIEFCKIHNYVPSKRLRKLLINDLNK